MERQRLMPRGHWGWRNEAWSTLSQGWRVGNLVFVGGQVALDDKGEVIAPGDIEAQTRAVYMAIDAVLQEAGARMSDVVKINSYLVTDLEGEEFETHWQKMARVRREFFPGEGPCGTGVVVPALVYPGLMIEVECIAAIPDERMGQAPAA